MPRFARAHEPPGPPAVRAWVSGCRRRVPPRSARPSTTWGWCSSIPRRPWPVPSIWCCSRGWARRFRVAELERLLWDERSLFEYWVHIVPTADLPIHRATMRRYPGWRGRRGPFDVHEALAAKRTLRSAATSCASCKRRGPLRARDLEDRTAEGWQTGGWNDERGRSVTMMLDMLWFKGEVMIVGRDGQQRIWDLAERSLPMDEPKWSQAKIVASARWSGSCGPEAWRTPLQFIRAFDGRTPGWERALTRPGARGRRRAGAHRRDRRKGSGTRTPRCSSRRGDLAPCCCRRSTTW